MKKFHTLWLCAFLYTHGGYANEQLSATNQKQTEEKQTAQYPIRIPFEKGMEIEREVKLSDIAESVEYLRLETTDKGLVKYFLMSMMHRTSKYYIFAEHQNVMQFTRDGKFVRNIGRRGQGPGEYNYIQQIDVDEKAGKVYVLSTGKRFNVYDLETGEFLQSGKLTHGQPRSFLMQNDSTMIAYKTNDNGQVKTLAYRATLSGNVLHEYPRHELFEVERGAYMVGNPHDFYFSRFHGMVNLKEYENDTVYTVTPEGKVIKCPDVPKHLQVAFRDKQLPGFNHEIWHYGNTDEMKFAYTFSDTLYTYDHKTNRLRADFVMKNYRKSDDTYCIHFPMRDRCITWVKGKGSIVTDMKTRQSHFFELKNDFMGGLPINNQSSNGYLWAMYEPMQLMEIIEERLEQSDCTEADRKVLKELYNSLDEDDNNIMFIGRLKR